MNDGAPQEEPHEESAWRRIIHDRMNAFERRMDEFDSSLAKNTETTNAIKQDTAAIVTFSKDAEGAVRLLKQAGAVAKPLVAIGTFVALCWAGIKAAMHWGGGQS
jgi:hypothetical protein